MKNLRVSGSEKKSEATAVPDVAVDGADVQGHVQVKMVVSNGKLYEVFVYSESERSVVETSVGGVTRDQTVPISASSHSESPPARAPIRSSSSYSIDVLDRQGDPMTIGQWHPRRNRVFHCSEYGAGPMSPCRPRLNISTVFVSRAPTSLAFLERQAFSTNSSFAVSICSSRRRPRNVSRATTLQFSDRPRRSSRDVSGRLNLPQSLGPTFDPALRAFPIRVVAL
ncbi:hypothetical protein EVAR_67513_1 [Eumeta japonica]|uniref:Uncharacterized protein n=1 Tax=Eumeta variegata TaxID=151549 RepID=A0A4C1YYR8_EUMVA|nr:hypothetical protein EVAR_67513_1 [Eumeta japonica]